MKTDYYIGSVCSGQDDPNEKFNSVMTPRLQALGIKDKNMDEVARMFIEIYQIGYRNGVDNALSWN